MAKYCKECSLRIFSKDYGDFCHDEEELIKVFCVSCGYIKVNKEGKKVE